MMHFFSEKEQKNEKSPKTRYFFPEGILGKISPALFAKF